MNAIEFVKKYGLETTKQAVYRDTAPYAKAVCVYNGKLTFSVSVGGPEWVLIDELKQIVEAFELVEKFGGFDNSNKTLKKAYDNYSSIISIRKIGVECSYSDLQEAINLVEQCQ